MRQKTSLHIFAFSLCAVLSSFGSAAAAETSRDLAQIQQVLTRYFEATYARDFKRAYSYISAPDRRLKDEAAYSRERGSFDGFTLEMAQQLARYIEITMLENRITGPRAYVKIAIKAPDPEKIAPLVYGWDSDRLERLSGAERRELLTKLDNLHREHKLELYQGPENVELVKESEAWKLFLNWAAGKQVSFKTTMAAALPLQARLKQPQIAARAGENFTISLFIKNSGTEEVRTRIGHLVDPFEYSDYLDLIECGFLYPVKLPVGKETEFTATYRIRDSIPDSVQQLIVTYAFTPSK